MLAFGRGGACETVEDGVTGLLFAEQTVDSLIDCIQQFETSGVSAGPEEIRDHSRRFSEERFERELRAYCARRLEDWAGELYACSHHTPPTED